MKIMNEIQYYIKATITILGIAYPILLQVIARLDEKYSSSIILELFESENINKLFRLSLISSLVFIFFWSLKLEPLFQKKGFNFFINNSGVILVMANVIILIFLFFLFVNKTLTYYSPAKFLKYLFKRHRKEKNQLDYKNFQAIGDILLLSVRKQNTSISRTITNFLHEAFRNERLKQSDQEVIYPFAYYELVTNTIEELAILKEKRNKALEYRMSGGVYLLGEIGEHHISEETYYSLWNNILIAIEYNRDDLIATYWEKAHQFIAYNLNHIQEEYNFETQKIDNSELIEKRNKERNRFLEFHIALGGLLMYKKKYTLIHRFFSYSQSSPPTYELLPNHMEEVFGWFFRFLDKNHSNFTWISRKYKFPDLKGSQSDDTIKRWILNYVGVLFLRQYSIIPYLITMRPLDFPTIPEKQGDKRTWFENLDIFKHIIKQHLENISLLEILELNFITKEWCEESEGIYPIDFIEKLKKLVLDDYNTNATVQTISAQKVNKFKDSTMKIFESGLKILMSLDCQVDSDKPYKPYYLYGKKAFIDKDAFSENSEINHVDFDSYFASKLIEKILKGIPNLIEINCSKSYTFKPENLFKAVDKLNINKSFIIISVGINLAYYRDQLNIPNLSEKKFRDIELVSFNYSGSTPKSLFILKKKNLPKFIFYHLKRDKIEKYHLERISSNHNIYASVLDLNTVSQEFLNEINSGNLDELKKKVMLTIMFMFESQWKKNVPIIQIKEYSQYRQNGLINNFSDIEKLSS